MGLDLTTIGTLVLFAIGYMLLIPSHLRQWTLFLASGILIFVLQPDIFVRWMDFILPLLTLCLTVAGWYITRREEYVLSRQDMIAGLLLAGLIVSFALLRYVDADWRWFIPSRPPPILILAAIIIFIGLITFAIYRLPARLIIFAIMLIGIFVLLKTEFLAETISVWWRTGTGQDVSQASAVDLNWLGFSYVAFRLIHTLRDRQSGLLPDFSLRDYVTYVLFFPSFIAGPIDRAERFLDDFSKLRDNIQFSERYQRGLTRISIGIGKKFVIADTLAQGMALNPQNALQIESTTGAWLLLYGYALRLYFDFSGYTDIAIGIGILSGIDLPENFNNPYRRTSITKFWQSWHITLSNWVRFYVFSPLSRYLLKRKPKPSPVLIVLITQLVTMIVIALWHGMTLNFLIWGIWHGLGLWLHKQFSDRTRKFYRDLKQKPVQQRIADTIAWVITFHFVVLGWVWFAIPAFDSALMMFAILIGIH